VFLCHSSADKQAVRQLCEWLERDGFDPWLDEKKLLPAQRWQDVIEDAVRGSDVVLVCLTAGSVSKEGYLQREIKFALQIADEKPDETIYIVPTRLEPVDLPRRFRDYQAANLYEVDGYEKLRRSLAMRAAQISVAPPQQSSGVHLLQIGRSAPKSAPAPDGVHTLRWMNAHPRIVISAVVLFLGVTGFGSYNAYEQQKRQRVAASQFFREGVASWKTLDLRKAESSFSQAAAAEPDDPLILASYALSLNERGNEGKARSLAKLAFNTERSLTGDERELVEGIYNEVNANWSEAEKNYAGLWQRKREAESAIRLAHVQTLGGAPEEAIKTIEQIPAPDSDDPRVMLEKASAQRVLGKFEAEIKTLGRILDEHPANDPMRAIALAERCWADYNSRDLNEPLKTALDDCTQAENIFNDKEDALGQARTLTREALIISDKDNPKPDYAKAVELQKRSIDITHDRSAIRDEAGGHQNLANILMQQTKPNSEAARTEYEKSEEMFKSLGDTAGMAGVYNDQAVRLINLCSYQDALNSAKQAGQIWNAMRSADEAIALSNQGSMELYLGDLPGAEAHLKTALSMSDQKLNVDRNNWLITLGEVYSAEGKLALAEQCYKGGPCYDNKQPYTVHGQNVLADAVVDYSALQIENKNLSNAEQLAQGVLKKKRDDTDPDEQAWARVVLANALVAEGKNSLLGRAKDAIADVSAIGPKDCRVGIAMALTLARIEGRSGNFEDQKETLNRALQKAHDLGLLGYVFEATLDEAEIDLRAGQLSVARDKAEQLISQSGTRGFRLMSAKASELVSRAKNAGATGN
jgi:Tfp pilus assembly protein PilF